jgi:hypothetical protein
VRPRQIPDRRKLAATSNGVSAVAFQDTNSHLVAEMHKRGMFFNGIDWFEGQGKLPLD